MNTIEVLRRLDSETKAEVFLVGGFVRDFLRKRKNHDLDVVVRNLSPRNIKKFLVRYGKLKEIRLSKTNDLFSVDILLFRASSDSTEAQITLPRRSKRQIPDSRNTLRQDSRFRDFRINCLYLPVNFKSRADVIDLVDGKKDIIQRKITANGSARERIKESPIRMLRAISIAARIKYSLDKELENAIRENAGLIRKCPAEAIRYEFEKIIMSSHPSTYLKLLNKTGLLKYIAPELARCVGVKQNEKYHKYDVFTHLIYTVDNCEKDLIIRLAGLLHDVGKPAVKGKVMMVGEDKVTFHKHEVEGAKIAHGLLKRLKFDNKIVEDVVSLVRLHMFHYTREWTDSAIRKFIKRSGLSSFYMTAENISSFPLFKLRAAERLGNGLKDKAVTNRQLDFEKNIIRIFNESRGLEIKDLDINGNVIMDTFNIRPGVHVGDLLKSLLEKVLEKPGLNNRLDLLKLATEYIYSKKVKE